MIWSKGFSASCYMARVDPLTWRDIERIEITGGQIKRATDGLMQSADIDCVGLPRNVEMWVRVYMNAEQNGAYSHEALFTGLATTPDQEINGAMRTSTATCYSVLKPADDVLLPRGWYIAAGTDGAAAASDLLSVSPAPISVEGPGPGIASTIVAEDGETRLSMAERILDAINWRIRIAGDGEIQIVPQATASYAKFDPLENDVIETQLTVTMDWYECPNVLMAADEELTAIARDDSINSPLSTVNRGREVWAMETDCDLGENESLAEYAGRRLSELQQIEIAVEYDRRYVPDVLPGDLILMHYPAQDLEGLFFVDEQSIDVAASARTSERITAPAKLGIDQDKEIVTALYVVIAEDGTIIESAEDDAISGLAGMEVIKNGNE